MADDMCSTRQMLALFQDLSCRFCWQMGQRMDGPLWTLQFLFELKLKLNISSVHSPDFWIIRGTIGQKKLKSSLCVISLCRIAMPVLFSGVGTPLPLSTLSVCSLDNGLHDSCTQTGVLCDMYKLCQFCCFTVVGSGSFGPTRPLKALLIRCLLVLWSKKETRSGFLRHTLSNGWIHLCLSSYLSMHIYNMTKKCWRGHLFASPVISARILIWVWDLE